MKKGDIVYLNSDLKNENPLTITDIETVFETKLKGFENVVIEIELVTVSYFAKSKFGESKIDFKKLPIESLKIAPNEPNPNG